MKRKVLAACGGLATFGILTAAAASLGGLSSSSLGADQTVVASCDTDGIVLSYTNAYNTSTSAYSVAAVVATGVNTACNGKAYKLTLSNGGSSLGEWTSSSLTLSGTTLTIATTSPVVNSASVTSAALVITG